MAILNNLGNGFSRLLNSRAARAELDVHAYLASLDDTTLNRIGVQRKALKKGGRVNYFV